MIISPKWIVRILVCCGVILTTNLIYLWATIYGKPDYIFGGILFNPIDGYSYLSKMNEGWQGSWKFTLPYTSTNGKGEYLFLFYIFLGHISKWLSLPLPLTFHISRIISTILLIISLHRLMQRIFNDEVKQCWSLIFVVFGSGLGWIVLPFGSIMPDFWVAEIYPFLSIFANPHFPLGLAILVEIFIGLIPHQPEQNGKFYFKLLFYALTLALLLPFGIILVYIIFILWGIFLFLSSKIKHDVLYSEKYRSLFLQFVVIFSGSCPVLFYQMWVVRTNPLIAIWNQQNQTPSPPFWKLIIALSPAMILAIVGIKNALQQKYLPTIILIVWSIGSLSCAYFPFYLQRRLLLGAYIPFAILSIYGIEFICHRFNLIKKGYYDIIVYAVVLLFSVITNLILQMSTLQAISRYDKNLYLHVEEYLAITWLGKILPAQSVVLASPETSLFIPAFSGHKVVYGHPYETVNATVEKEFVIYFFQETLPDLNKSDICNQLTLHGIDYIFIGPRELLLSPVNEEAILDSGLSPIYQNSQVMILTCD